MDADERKKVQAMLITKILETVHTAMPEEHQNLQGGYMLLDIFEKLAKSTRAALPFYGKPVYTDADIAEIVKAMEEGGKGH